MRDSSDVLIVGAGVAGLSLALRLGAKGYRVSILQGGELPPVYRPEMIQPAGLQAMAELGLFKSLEEISVARVQRFHFDRMGGRPAVSGRLPRALTCDAVRPHHAARSGAASI